MKTTVAVLLYGDHHDLAERCLTSLKPLVKTGRVRVRLGLNQVCDATKDLVASFHDSAMIVESSENLKKYPMMRRMFYDTPLETDFVMWFDDDSYLKDAAVSTPEVWLDEVEALLSTTADMIGSPYGINLRSRQHEWIMKQPWYANKTVKPGKVVMFATGGWWAIRSSVLRTYDWPPTGLLHRGGDVMLGELLRQCGLRLKSFRKGVAINADIFGRESASPRRGFDEPPIGVFGANDDRSKR